jgi:hypothetical protein
MVACRPMAALVPLMTAAALALAGWLASGVVTVRSLDAPARIGLLPPPSTLLAFLLPLLALSGLWRRDDGWRAAALRVVCILLPVTVPWLPLPLPAALLAWTGPLALGWWAASVACVYADAFVALAAPVRTTMVSPARAPVVAALVTGALLCATAWHTAPQHPKGDEPDYLVISQSLLLDRDLRIENNHTRADYAPYHPGGLPPSYLARGTNGQIYSVHAPGLPLLLVPGFALAGYGGVLASLVLFAMAGAWLAWHTCWAATRDAVASWIGVLATVGAAPFFLHGAAVFPDAPASVLALFAVSTLLHWRRQPDGVIRALSPARACLVALALGAMPWLHTRYALLSAGLGAAVCASMAARRDWRGSLAFGAPASLLAIAWFGFFFVIYGTPSPSAAYGAYTQMALTHLWPGIPGLLFDQQFGLLASAPVLALAILALRSAARATDPAAWRIAALVIGLAFIYTAVVGAYRMWWGGLSAPARFLVPLVLPLAPLIAIGWQSLRTRASRHLAVTLLVASLAMTAVLICVDHGSLAYNDRDGRARWALWASPLVDLVAALPAAHRDAPAVVLRDAGIWIAATSLAWVLARGLERRGRLSPLGTAALVACLLPAASAIAWAWRGVNGLAPAASQIAFLERQVESRGDALIAITPPPRGRTRNWFVVEIDSRRPRTGQEYSVLRVDRLPAGRYRLFTDVITPEARLGVTLGQGRTSRFIADLDASRDRTSTPFDLALPVQDVVVKGSREAVSAARRTWLVAGEVRSSSAVPATRTQALGGTLWLLPEDGIYPEPEGAWLAGDADVIVGVTSSEAFEVSLRAGAAPVVVRWSGAGEGEARLAAGETRVVTMAPRLGLLTLRARGGFRPAQVSPGNGDHRYLGVWISTP